MTLAVSTNPDQPMPFLPSLLDDASLRQVFSKFPTTSAPLLDYHEVLLRGPSPLSVAERELIAAYVSGLNACAYCRGIHARTAAEFGVEESLLTALVEDPATAPVSGHRSPTGRSTRCTAARPQRYGFSNAQRARSCAAAGPCASARAGASSLVLTYVSSRNTSRCGCSRMRG
jgi:AhpD family alkylhydroperoxidase